MSRKLTQVTILAAAVVSLSGCTHITKLGDNMWGHTKNAWGYTKSTANFVASPVTKLLRSAPEQNYVFDDASRAQHLAKQAFLSDSHSLDSQGLAEFERAQRPISQTPNYRNPVYSSQHNLSGYDNPPAVPSRVAQVQAAPPLAAPQTSNNISFVKMGGGSNMQDWVLCEAEAGGFIRVVQGGYLIDPGFESCMRAKGYKPESEVADQLSL